MGRPLMAGPWKNTVESVGKTLKRVGTFRNAGRNGNQIEINEMKKTKQI